MANDREGVFWWVAAAMAVLLLIGLGIWVMTWEEPGAASRQELERISEENRRKQEERRGDWEGFGRKWPLGGDREAVRVPPAD